MKEPDGLVDRRERLELMPRRMMCWIGKPPHGLSSAALITYLVGDQELALALVRSMRNIVAGPEDRKPARRPPRGFRRGVQDRGRA